MLAAFFRVRSSARDRGISFLLVAGVGLFAEQQQTSHCTHAVLDITNYMAAVRLHDMELPHVQAWY